MESQALVDERPHTAIPKIATVGDHGFQRAGATKPAGDHVKEGLYRIISGDLEGRRFVYAANRGIVLDREVDLRLQGAIAPRGSRARKARVKSPEPATRDVEHHQIDAADVEHPEGVETSGRGRRRRT